MKIQKFIRLFDKWRQLEHASSSPSFWSVRLFGDGSGRILDPNSKVTYEFSNIFQLIDKLKCEYYGEFSQDKETNENN